METTTCRPIKCKDCMRRFHSISALQQHTRYHRRVWLYQCSVCSKSFRGLEQLKRHQVVHDNEKPLECGWCSEMFLEQYQLAIHLFRKHKIVASSIGLAAKVVPDAEPGPMCTRASPLETSVQVNIADDVSADGGEHIGKGIDSVESSCLEVERQVNVITVEDRTVNGEANDKNCGTMIEQSSMDLNGNATVGLPRPSSNECEDSLYQLVDNSVISPHAEDMDSTVTDDSADINEAIMLLTGLKDADVSSEEKSSCTALEDDQAHFSLSLMTDDSSQDSTCGVVNGSATVMMRGDPSLHQCPSREDLLLFEESVAFSEDGDAEKKPLEMSASCGSLSALMMAGTPHKLSVDPGAASANASPAMSPFHGDSDTDTELEPLPGTDRVTADKESAISPGHTETCNDLPIQPGAITFKAEHNSNFPNFKTLTKEEMPISRKSSLKDLRLVTETLPVDNQVASKKYIIKDKNSPEKELKDDMGKSPRKRRKRVAYKDSDFVYDYQELAPGQNGKNPEEKPLIKQVGLENQESDVDSSSGSSTQRPIKKKRGRPKRFHSKEVSQLNDLMPATTDVTSEKSKYRQPLSRFTKRKMTTRWKNSEGNSNKDTTWGPELSDESESQITSKGSSSKDSDSGMEYKLRPKRRKNYQLLADPKVKLVEEDQKRQARSVNMNLFRENVSKVEDLRVLVTRLIMTVFPDITYPNLFQEEGLSVDYLMDEIMGAMFETQPKNNWTPFGGVEDDLKVVLCKRPEACLCHLRRKAARLLNTILPDAQEPCPTEGPGVEALIREVIQSNIKANSQ